MADQVGRSRSDSDALVLALSRLRSIDVRRPARIAAVALPSSIVMVGGMCAGKSTLAYAAATHPTLVGRCEVVRRCSTRPPRHGDADDGVSSVSWEDFRSIGYGCLPPVGQGVPILMAGHGVYSNKESVRPLGALERALVVGVMAPLDVRTERLRGRSPDVVQRGPSQISVLLAHNDTAMGENVDLVVQNHGSREATAANDFVAALSLILAVAPV
jgi:hypothetical protein